MKVLILGAGASSGHGVPGGLKPPLVEGFLKHAIILGLQEDYEPLFEYISTVCGLSLDQVQSANIEKLFAEIEPIWRLKVFGHDRSEVVRRYGECFRYVTPLDMLHSLIADVILLSTVWLRDQECPYHMTIVDRWLKRGDIIISLNYDLIIDSSLRCSARWHESTGYGWIVPGRTDKGYVESDIHLFKLHGSLNWRKKKAIRHLSSHDIKSSKSEKYETISVSDVSEVTQQKEGTLWEKVPPKIAPELVVPPFKPKGTLGDLFFSMTIDTVYPLIEGEQLSLLVLPTPRKPFEDMTYAELGIVWQKTRRAIQEAEEIWICGYSLGDPHLNQLITESCRNRQGAPHMFLVDKNPETVEKAKEIFKIAGLIPELAFDSLEGFARNAS